MSVFLTNLFFLSLLVTPCIAQVDYEMPVVLGSTDSTISRPPTLEEIHDNFENLMQSTDTSLNHSKKVAQRWMNYVLPYLNYVPEVGLTRAPFNEALNAIYTSPLQCGDPDLSQWKSDGPKGVEAWQLGARPQQSGGWVDAVYANANDLDEMLVGTRTSGIMRTTNGGDSWYSATDGLSFPVLGNKQFLVDPADPERILALTGTQHIEGSLIYSNDAGESWSQNQQQLPEFQWMCYHPTLNNLIFAVAKQEVWVSYDNGVNFSLLGAPADLLDDTTHKIFRQIFVLDDHLYCVSAFNYSPGAQIYKCDFSNVDINAGTMTTEWTSDVENDFMEPGKVCIGAKFSNIALDRFYLIVRQADDVEASFGNNRLYKYDMTTNTYNYNSALSGSSTFPFPISNVVIDFDNLKCEIIASENDPNILYNGQIREIRRWDDITGLATKIEGAAGDLNGHHDDYRSSQILSVNGEDRLLFGNDGGVAIVPNGLETNPNPLMYSLNGNLSINLIHGFNVHEETGRTLYAFQDHKMIYRDNEDDYSQRFLHEGSFAMIQQNFVNGIVGSTITTIQDAQFSSNDIVDGTFTTAYMYAYQTHYRHFPARFAAGLEGGEVAMNRGVGISDEVPIPIFQDQGEDSDDDYEVGDVAICQRNPNFIYAARNPGGGHDPSQETLVKSTDDGYNWTSLSASMVEYDAFSALPLQNITAWKGIRALAVDHFDENLVYCGIGRTYTDNGSIQDEKFRVLKSTTGGEPNPNNPFGAAWVDYSEGLPALPVERLLTVESDNQLIFCATSVGIYYRTDAMSQWECFSQDLPKGQITGMQYDYCNNVLYASVYGRGLWRTDVGIPVVNSYSEIIDSNETWDEEKTIHTDVRVETGNTLTITATIRMATDATFTIEPGAELVLNGGTLTNACGETWQGIEVWGNANASQTPSNQGVLKVINGALIENARNAVTLWKPDDWSKTGGIVQASNSTFLNNRRSVEFMSYQNEQVNGVIASNRSYFRNCTFETNDDCIIPEEQNEFMITMWQVSGVGIWGCEFNFDRTVSTAGYLRGAIGTSDANFTVDNYCDGIQQIGQPCPVANTTQSTFTGFNKAIHARGAEQNVGPTIKNAVFDKNMIGIEFDAVIAPSATFNDFTVGNNDFPPVNNQSPLFHLGIHSNNCDEYILEENSVEGDDVNGFTTHGIYVYDDMYSANSNQIYKNSYEDVSSATIASGLHADPSDLYSYTGLKFICNSNEDNNQDFEVRGWGAFGDLFSEINNFQDDGPATSAGNSFSVGNSGDGVYTHLDFYSNVTYEYNFDPGSTDPDEDEIYIPSPATIELMEANNLSSCETNFPEGDGQIDVGFQLGKFSNNKDEFNNLYYTYLQLLDEGNTDGMIMEIDLTWPEDAWDLHAELLSRSPYNSEAVLIAAADKNVLTHGMLLEVLLANPDALRSGTVISHVENNIANPLPQYMIDILYMAASTPQTVRTEMERNLSSLHQEMVSSHKLLVNHHLNDTVNALHPDTLINWFSQIRNLSGRYQQIFAYTGVNQYANAFAVIDSIETNYKLSNEQHQELTNAEDFVTYLENLHTDGRNVAQITPSELPELERIANQVPGGIAAERAE
ncbi:MAG: hypothetical protein LC664_13920, partial [Flavobacteriales bacterium]|nr:hypothetical protein [Flavobacteriales bacterium]